MALRRKLQVSPLIPSQFAFIRPPERETDRVLKKEERGGGRFTPSQVVRVDDGKVRVLAVGGAVVWAGGARGGASHQGVVESPG